MRLLVARCEVRYTGRLTAVLPLSMRLLMLEKDGVERDLQAELAAQPEVLEDGLRLVQREWPTDIGPVDLMCRDEDGGWAAVEVKRVATIEAVEQLCRYLERIRLDPATAGCRGILVGQRLRPQAGAPAPAR